MTEQGLIALCNVIERFNMFFGHDQNVRRGLRIEVAKGISLIIFVHFSRWYFAGDDPAECAIAFQHLFSCIKSLTSIYIAQILTYFDSAAIKEMLIYARFSDYGKI